MNIAESCSGIGAAPKDIRYLTEVVNIISTPTFFSKLSFLSYRCI
jgi:hypothetical protein